MRERGRVTEFEPDLFYANKRRIGAIVFGWMSRRLPWAREPELRVDADLRPTRLHVFHELPGRLRRGSPRA